MRHTEREERLHHNLVALAADYQLDGFGTKFGGLRTLLSDRFDEAGEYDGASYRPT